MPQFVAITLYSGEKLFTRKSKSMDC